MPTAFNRHSLFSPFLNRGRGLSQELGDFFPPFQSCGLGLGLRHQGQAGPELFCLSLAATFSGARRLHEEYDAIQLRCHISLRPHYSTYLISRVPAPGEPIANGHKWATFPFCGLDANFVQRLGLCSFWRWISPSYEFFALAEDPSSQVTKPTDHPLEEGFGGSGNSRPVLVYPDDRKGRSQEADMADHDTPRSTKLEFRTPVSGRASWRRSPSVASASKGRPKPQLFWDSRSWCTAQTACGTASYFWCHAHTVCDSDGKMI